MLPGGTVTFLFTDIVGSTAKWEADPAAMAADLEAHNKVLGAVMERRQGHVFKTVGDAYCVAFASADAAVAAADEVHLGLAQSAPTIQVRIGLHTGSIFPIENDYFGPPVNKVARIQAVASGGQTLMSGATHSLLDSGKPTKNLGTHLLKDLLAPTEIWQLGDQEFAPIQSLSSVRTNLPIQASSFIGRQTEIEELGRKLRSARLITLTGAGGTGKTRLALQVAAQVLEDFPDGVWFVEFAPLLDRSVVAREIASTLGIKDQGASEVDLIVAHLNRQRALLIFDNCEHVLREAAEICERLFSRCPNLVVMATSREPLGAKGEQIYAVASLDAPSLAQAKTVQDLTHFGATALFLDRLAMVAPNHSVSTEQVAMVRNICERLDGIPFAIELAAARGRSMAIAEIEKRLDDRFRLLTGGSRTAVSRQQTLRAMIDWSVQLLNEDQRKLFVALSVFVGGWTLDLAEQVCGLEEIGIDSLDVLDLLSALVDKSLVEFHSESGRYKLLESVRHYALELLEKEPWAITLRDRHAQVLVDLISRNREDRAQRFYEEIENYQAAIEWLLTDVKSVNVVTESLRATRGLWYLIRRWDRYLELSERLLKVAEAVMVPDVLAGLRTEIGVARIMRQDPDSERILQELLDRHNALDEKGQTRTAGNIHYVLFYVGRIEEAVRMIESQPVDERSELSLHTLANCYFCLGEAEKAVTFFGQSADKSLDSGTRVGRRNGLHSAAEVRAYQGDLKDSWRRILYSLQEEAKHLGRLGCGQAPFAALAAAGAEPWACALAIARSEAIIASPEHMSDPYDLKMLEFAMEVARPFVNEELMARARQSNAQFDRQPWLRSLLEVKLEDIFREDGTVKFPNPHLLPQAPLA